MALDTPIIVPPMAGAAGGKLAAEVTLAGGFGFVGVGYGEEAGIREIEVAKSILRNFPDKASDFGVGFLCWMLDEKEQLIKVLQTALEARVKCIWLSFGDDIGKWVDYIRKYDEARDKPHKTLIWVLINSVKEAQRAVDDWHADVLVVQGIEAGGHGHGEALPLLTLLPMVKQSLPNSPPLVAAGGITTGAQVASLLVLGAAAAAIGTRYVVTHESLYSPNQKQAMLNATYSVRSYAFDIARGTTGWPSGVDARGLPNEILKDVANGVPIEEQKKLYAEATENDDVSRIIVWSGASVGLIKEVASAAAVTRAIHEDIVTQLEEARNLLQGH